MAITEKQQRFIEDIAKHVQKYARAYGILVHSPIIAQAILESGWGESKLASKYHNYFGMKCGTTWKGKSVNMETKEEYTPGTLTTIDVYKRQDINSSELIKRVTAAGAKRVEIKSPVFQKIGGTSIAYCTSKNVTYGGVEDD